MMALWVFSTDLLNLYVTEGDLHILCGNVATVGIFEPWPTDVARS